MVYRCNFNLQQNTFVACSPPTVLDKEGDTSILKTKEASYVNGKLVLNGYLDKYPFPLYILLSHVEALPETLADALRQWFELLQRQTAT